jgi:N-acetylglutamate synthase-like GNAT family acetyltransferase
MPSAIRIATERDLPFVLDLQRKFSNELGFIPRAGTEWYVINRRVLLARENGDPAGFLLGRPRLRYQPKMRPIYQAGVRMDAQRRHNGLQLLDELAADAALKGQVALQAMCREDLESNDFWAAAGFEPICKVDPSNARGKLVICWRRALSPSTRPAWFYLPPPVAGHKARKTTIV